MQVFKHSFGHGGDGPANLLAELNLPAFGLHAVADSLQGLWQERREFPGTRKVLFNSMRDLMRSFQFPHGRSLPGAMLGRKDPPPQPERRAPGPAREDRNLPLQPKQPWSNVGR